MNSGRVVERGIVTTPKGEFAYRLWECFRTKKRFGYVGPGKGKRRSKDWIREHRTLITWRLA